MADIFILRAHQLGFEAARQIAAQWADQLVQDFHMECTYVKGDALDKVLFQRSGVSGVLQVTGAAFELDAKLGFLLRAFKDQIEAEIRSNLERQLQPKA
ncbi:MAG: polyhydroxyalkanoic acid system family protein [Rhodoferax sp.]|nr:polyhydroxyalkanoic acid system family protein [Rhodoferax sp.]